ncbi:MAG: hypothetical protein Kow0019_17660 [Methanobacteriaceae archaeon]
MKFKVILTKFIDYNSLFEFGKKCMRIIIILFLNYFSKINSIEKDDEKNKFQTKYKKFVYL